MFMPSLTIQLLQKPIVKVILYLGQLLVDLDLKALAKVHLLRRRLQQRQLVRQRKNME